MRLLTACALGLALSAALNCWLFACARQARHAHPRRAEPPARHRAIAFSRN